MQCSEICGVFHGSMPVVLEAVSINDYLIWLSSFNTDVADLINLSIILSASVRKNNIVKVGLPQNAVTVHSDAKLVESTEGNSSIANPISTSNLENKPSVLNPMWVTGFTDAEGSFHASAYKKSINNKWVVTPRFEITLNSVDFNILQEIKDFFGVGSIYTKNTQNVTSYIVTKKSDLINVIIPHFIKFPLQTQKRVDFELWSKILVLMKNKEHLTPEGLLKVMSLKTALNKGLLQTTIAEFENIEILNRPLHLVDGAEFKSIDPNWVSGFVAGDGSFEIRVRERENGHEVGLRWSIIQHIRDAHLLGIIASFMGCGKVYIRSSGQACSLVVQNMRDINNIIIPFFKANPIRSVKEMDFRDFVSASELMNKKAHLTPDGLAEIKLLSSNMNRNRVKD